MWKQIVALMFGPPTSGANIRERLRVKELALLVMLAIVLIPARATTQSQTPTVNVSVTVSVNGGAVVPAFTLIFDCPSGTRRLGIPMESGLGNFRVAYVRGGRTLGFSLPEGSCRVQWSGLPENYSVESITDGRVDLRRSLLPISRDAVPRLVIALGVEALRGRSVGGQVTGLPPQALAEQPSMALVGNGRLFSTKLKADGSFEFAQIPNGTYSAFVVRTLAIQPSPSKTVVVSGKDVTGVRIDMPPVKEVRGRVTVEGAGPLGSVQLQVSGGSVPRVVIDNVLFSLDGSFTIFLPQGNSRIAVNTNVLPVGYTLRSLQYGSTDLLADPAAARILAGDTAELRAVIAVTSVGITVRLPDSSEIFAAPDSPNAWVRVRGHVAGALPGNSRVLVNMQSAVLSRDSNLPVLRAPVNFDGSFEFPEVTQGRYNISAGTAGFAIYQSIVVTDKDIDGLELVIPRRKTVAGRMHAEGGGPLPYAYGFTLNTVEDRGVVVVLTPACNGAFLAGLPEGEYRISSGLPNGYVSAFAYGSRNLLRDTVRISPEDDAELRITFGPTSTAGVVGWKPFGIGNFSGLQMQRPISTLSPPASAETQVNGCVSMVGEGSIPVPDNLVLTFTGASSMTVPVMPDGAFRGNLPKGQYRVALSALPQGYVLKSISGGSTDLRRETLNLTDPQAFIQVVLEPR